MVRMTGYTTPPPYVVTSSSDLGGGPTTEAWHAFDQDVNYGWVSQAHGVPAWIQLDWGLGGGIKLRSYSLYCSPLSFFPQRFPASWRIEGSNNLINWFELDVRVGFTQASWLATPTKVFSYTTFDTAYRYTRLTVLGIVNSIDSGNFVAITDWVVSLLGAAHRLY